MAWLAVDKDGTEYIFADKKPIRGEDEWLPKFMDDGLYDTFCGYINLPKGSIKKLIGRELSWNDEPVELKEE